MEIARFQIIMPNTLLIETLNPLKVNSGHIIKQNTFNYQKLINDSYSLHLLKLSKDIQRNKNKCIFKQNLSFTCQNKNRKFCTHVYYVFLRS
jgi:hypothetical protein